MSKKTTDFQSLLQDLQQAVQGTNDFLSAVNAVRGLGGFEQFLVDNNFSGADLQGVNFSKSPDNAPSLKNANFIQADLKEANLSGLDLENANFEKAELQKAKLNNAKLNKVNFTQAKLNQAHLENVIAREAKLIKADLSGAYLTESDFRFSNFSEAKLCNAQLEKTDLTRAYLREADLTSANLKNAVLSNADLEEANLEKADLQGANLNLTNLKNTKIDRETNIQSRWRKVWEIVNDQSNKQLQGQNLSEAYLNYADLSMANLRKAILTKTTLKYANLSNAQLIEANLREAALSDAIFTSADLTRAILIKAGLTDANLQAANLTRVNLTDANLDRANLNGAKLTLANLTRASLEEVDLRGADLRQAKITNTNFKNADLRGADLRGVDRSTANFDGAKLDGTALNVESIAQIRPFVISAIPDQNSQQLDSIYGLLARYLSDKLTQSNARKQKIPVIYQKVNDYKEAVEGLRKGILDMVWFGGVTGMLAQKQVPQILAIAQRDIDEKFRSVFIARKDSGIEKISEQEKYQEKLLELRGKKFAFGDELSTSGSVMPLYFLKESGFKPEDLPVQRKMFSKSHDNTIDLVKTGQVDIGVLNIQVWESRKNNPDNNLVDLEAIWVSPTFYDYHWVIHNSASESFYKVFELSLPKKVQEILTQINHSTSEEKEILDLFGAEKFTEAQDDNYYRFDKILDEIANFLPSDLVRELTIGQSNS